MSNIRTLAGLTLVAVIGLGACASETPDASPDRSTTTEAPTATTVGTPAAPTTTVPPTTTTSENPEISNARRSAQSYLDLTGFSRQGLIDQLSSDFGDQYPLEVATAAVDSLDIDYNAEAVEAAQSYVDMTGFSHAGLVDQLSSDFGDKFTPEQAEHGASVALG